MDHMVTMARSKELFGPYEVNPEDPVLTNANTTNYCESGARNPLPMRVLFNMFAPL